MLCDVVFEARYLLSFEQDFDVQKSRSKEIAWFMTLYIYLIMLEKYWFYGRVPLTDKLTDNNNSKVALIQKLLKLFDNSKGNSKFLNMNNEH